MASEYGFLIDTSVLIRYLQAPDSLSATHAAILDTRADTHVSAAAFWEIEIKRAIGKLDVDDDLLGHVTDRARIVLDITAEDAIEAGRLPLHHHDPFDRVMIAQARRRRLSLVTLDRAFANYDVALA